MSVLAALLEAAQPKNIQHRLQKSTQEIAFTIGKCDTQKKHRVNDTNTKPLEDVSQFSLVVPDTAEACRSEGSTTEVRSLRLGKSTAAVAQ